MKHTFSLYYFLSFVNFLSVSTKQSNKLNSVLRVRKFLNLENFSDPADEVQDKPGPRGHVSLPPDVLSVQPLLLGLLFVHHVSKLGDQRLNCSQ